MRHDRNILDRYVVKISGSRLARGGLRMGLPRVHVVSRSDKPTESDRVLRTRALDFERSPFQDPKVAGPFSMGVHHPPLMSNVTDSHHPTFAFSQKPPSTTSKQWEKSADFSATWKASNILILMSSLYLDMEEVGHGSDITL